MPKKPYPFSYSLYTIKNWARNLERIVEGCMLGDLSFLLPWIKYAMHGEFILEFVEFKVSNVIAEFLYIY